MEKQDIELANKLNSDLSMAIESGSLIAGKVKSGNLRNYMFSHLEKYENLQNKLYNIVSTSNKKLKNTNLVTRAFIWMQAQLSVLRKNEESDYIESFIKGSEMGIESGNELLKKYNTSDKELKDLIFSLQSIELENIDKLKDYKKRTEYN